MGMSGETWEEERVRGGQRELRKNRLGLTAGLFIEEEDWGSDRCRCLPRSQWSGAKLGFITRPLHLGSGWLPMERESASLLLSSP